MSSGLAYSGGEQDLKIRIRMRTGVRAHIVEYGPIMKEYVLVNNMHLLLS